MSTTLPAGVYTSHVLGTDGRSIISPDTGAQFGAWVAAIRVYPQANAAGAWQQASLVLSQGAGSLPAGVYTSHVLGTDGRSIISADTGPQYTAWNRVYQLVAFADVTTIAWEVAGELNVVMTLPGPQGITVAGEISVAFTRVSGTVQLFGAFTHEGEVATVFRASVPGAFINEGELKVAFFTRGGQELGCITAPGVPGPAVAGGGPKNAVY